MSIRVTERCSFIRVRLGPTAGEDRRCCEGQVAHALAAHSIRSDGFALNDGGCCFVVQMGDEAALVEALRPLNVAVRRRDACVSLSVVPSLAAFAPPTAAAIVEALTAANVDVVHLVCNDWGATVVVPSSEQTAAVRTLAELYAPPAVIAA